MRRGFARIFENVFALRQTTSAGGYAFHFLEQAMDAGAGFRETPGERAPRRIEMSGITNGWSSGPPRTS